jgi:predicted Zn-dependent protease
LNSEAELAMVLGHEIGHVTARHSARTYSKQLLVMGGLLIGSLASEKFAKYAPYAALGVQFLFLKYSRDDERQADDLGVEYGYLSGYDPEYFDDFFVTLKRMKDKDRGGLNLPAFFSTHPETGNRIYDVMEKGVEMKQASPPTGRLTVKRDDYLTKINGLVYGDNPRQGYVANGIFYHPDLQFTFAVPNQWRVDNTSAMVQLQPSSEKAVMQFTISNASSPRGAFDNMVADMNVNIVDDEYIRINGHEAYIGIASFKEDEEVYALEIAGIRKGQNIYSFVGLTTANDFQKYRYDFERTINSFAHLENRNAMNVNPTRVEVRRITRNVSVEDYVNAAGIPADKREEFMLLNNVRLGEIMQTGRLVKVVR